MGERDVEDGVVGSETEVYEYVGPGVVEIQCKRTASERPEGAVCAGGLVYIRAWGVLVSENLGWGEEMYMGKSTAMRLLRRNHPAIADIQC